MKVFGIIIIVLTALAVLMGFVNGTIMTLGVAGAIGYFGAAALFLYLGLKLMKKGKK